MFKFAVVAAGAALISGSAVAADLIVDVPDVVVAEQSSAWRGVVELGGLARFAQDYGSDGDLDDEVWYPGAYASFARWGDLGTVKLGLDGYGEILNGDFEGSDDHTNANLGVIGVHLGVGDDMYAGIFGAVATYPNDEATDQHAGGAVGVEGVLTLDAAKFIGRLGYAYAPNRDYDFDGEGFDGFFVEGAVQYAVSDDLALLGNVGLGYSETFDSGGEPGGYVNWGVKAVYALPTDFAVNLVAAYEGIMSFDEVDPEERVINHTFKIGLSIPFGGAGTASDGLNPLASPRAPFQASVLADVM